MGYYFAFSPCYGCRQLFSYNPELVPSVVVGGVREPICAVCVERANPRRRERSGADPPAPRRVRPRRRGPG